MVLVNTVGWTYTVVATMEGNDEDSGRVAVGVIVKFWSKGCNDRAQPADFSTSQSPPACQRAYYRVHALDKPEALAGELVDDGRRHLRQVLAPRPRVALPKMRGVGSRQSLELAVGHDRWLCVWCGIAVVGRNKTRSRAGLVSATQKMCFTQPIGTNLSRVEH